MRRHATLLFTATVAANAALLFAVEPLVSRLVLPLLGGTPAVWNTCLVFFQGLLLAGYAYAHLSTRRLAPRRQAAVHLALAAASLAALPVALPRGWAPPPGGAPVAWLVGLLLLVVGGPFFVLSAGAPLLQHWFARVTRGARDPYPLYAASNAGSLAALLAYPLLLEPRLPLAAQGVWWGAAYGAVLAMTAGIAVLVWRAERGAALAPAAGADAIDAGAIDAGVAGAGVAGAGVAGAGVAGAGDSAAVGAAPVGWRRALRWGLLAAAPSMLLMGVTRFLTTDVAPVPLLWVVPLALYLLTFVDAFAARPLAPREGTQHVQAALLLTLVAALSAGTFGALWATAALHLAAFAATALVCHRALADDRPSPARLTEYYLWISAGGFAGGVAAALVAPRVFDTLAEYPLAIALAAALRPGPAREPDPPATRYLTLLVPPRREPSRRVRRLQRALVPLAATLLAYVAARRADGVPEKLVGTVTGGSAALAAIAVLAVRRDRAAFALGVAAMLAAGEAGRRARESGVIVRARSFFGTYTVRRSGTYHHLTHGTTLHGAQDTARPTEMLTYYHRQGPLGRLFSYAPAASARRVAMVGLGTGTTACYGGQGDVWTFYEIDPLVARMAADPRLFTYLRDCAPRVEVVLGDARLRLAEAPAGAYDVILLDAFSSDAIPMHLLTREALALYLDKLAPGGVIAFHISNRYLDLQPPLAELARAARLAGAVGHDVSDAVARHALFARSTWVVLSRRPADLAELAREPGWAPLPPGGRDAPWTDDWSDVFGVVKWK